MSENKITAGSVVFYRKPEVFGAAKELFSGPGTVLSVDGDIAKVMWQNGKLSGPAFHHLTSLIPAGEAQKESSGINN